MHTRIFHSGHLKQYRQPDFRKLPYGPNGVEPSRDAVFGIVFALSTHKFAYSKHRFINVSKTNFQIMQLNSL